MLVSCGHCHCGGTLERHLDRAVAVHDWFFATFAELTCLVRTPRKDASILQHGQGVISTRRNRHCNAIPGGRGNLRCLNAAHRGGCRSNCRHEQPPWRRRSSRTIGPGGRTSTSTCKCRGGRGESGR
jgi:hypothetical protein